MELKLGSIKRVECRKVWKREDSDFTPWLASNVAELGNAIGLQLERVAEEASVGDYSLDILAKDLGSNAYVVIENQLEPTDHRHLGQLLTYASGFDADVVIWVATEFREEHRQAIDWLNSKSGASTNFFGIVIEVLQIGTSALAPQFKVVASPNEWQKAKSSKKVASETGERGEAYRDYFQPLMDELREQHHFTKARKAQPQNWYTFASGCKWFKYGHTFSSGGKVRVEVYIDCDTKDEVELWFQHLFSSRSKIESDFGGPLEWEKLDGRASRIAFYREGSIEDSAETLEEIRAWAVSNLLKLSGAFKKYASLSSPPVQ